MTDDSDPLISYGLELARRDAANPVRCDTCRGAHGVVRVCGGCEEPENDCVCAPAEDVRG